MVMAHAKWHERLPDTQIPGDSWEYERVTRDLVMRFDAAIAQDLNTAEALTVLEEMLGLKKVAPECVVSAASKMDSVLGLDLFNLTRADLRIRPVSAVITEAEIDAALARRKEARAAKDFAASDAIRDELSQQGVEVMDGDPLGWEWKLA